MNLLSAPAPRMARLRKQLGADGFWRDGVLIFIATMGSNGLAFLLHFFASRWLGVRDYGTFSTMLAVLVVISVAATIASTFVARVTATYYAANDFGAVRSFRGRLVRADLTGSVAFTLCLAGMCIPVSRFLAVSTTEVLITAAALGLAVGCPPLRAMLQGTHRFGALAISLLVEALGRFVAVLGFVAHGWGAGGAIAGLAVGTLLSLVYTAYAIAGFGRSEDGDVHDLRDAARSTLSIAVVIFSITALSSYDLILVRHFFSAQISGLYSALALVGRTVFLLISFIPTVLLPKTAASRTNQRDSRALLVRALAAGLLLSVGVFGLALAAPARFIGMLAGTAYVSAAPYVLAYASAIILLALANVIATYQIGLGHRRFGLYLAGAGAFEVALVCLRHGSLREVVEAVLVGHSLVLLSSFVGIGTTHHERPVRAEAF